MSMYEVETETIQITEGNQNVDCIVLLVDDELFGKKSYDVNLLGEKMCNWVARACPTKPTIAPIKDEDDLLGNIRPLLKDAQYTMVLYSDTPLITANAVNQILDYVSLKNLSVCKLARAWVFKTEYIKQAQTVYALNQYDVCSNEQYQVSSVESFEKAAIILQARVNKYHMQNGVNIVSPQNTHIDCQVAIEAGAIIEPFVKLEGTTSVGANSKICSNCVITDSKIDEQVIIKSGTVIVRSAVLDNAIVGNNCLISNRSVVGEETIVSAATVLENSTTNKGCKVGLNCCLTNTKVADGVNIGSGTKCLGTEALDVKLGANSTVGEACTIFGGVYLKSDYTLPQSTTLAKKD